MAGKKSGNELNVAMNDRLVGYLRKHANGSISFTYDKNWLLTDGARAISLSLPLQEHTYYGDAVYNFFDNLLPDSPAIRERIQRHFQTKTNQPFDLLSSIGLDCIGAIQLYPSKEQSILKSVKEVNAVPLSDIQIANLLRNYKDAPLGMNTDNSDFRISLAGTQEKTALLNYKGQWYKPINSTPTSHIIKLPIGNLIHHNIDLSDSCENEWLCLKLVHAYGLPTAEAELITFGGQKTIVIKRFDRKWSQDGCWLMRLPQEDFCQALNIPSARKYQSDGGLGIEQCMALLMGSSEKQDREIFFKTQIVFWLLAAIDGHAKNFSLFIQSGSSFKMTPLYDIISAYPLLNNKQLQKQKIKMAMFVSGKNKHYHWDKIQPRHFIETGERVGLSEEVIIKMFAELKAKTPIAIKAVREQLPSDFPIQISETIFSGLSKQAEKLPI